MATGGPAVTRVHVRRLTTDRQCGFLTCPVKQHQLQVKFM
jgi:hypothetical protein